MLSKPQKNDPEMLAFQAKLLASVQAMGAGRAAKRSTVKVSPVVAARHASGLSQSKFAELLGISVRTLQKWEQGEREPSGAAKSLIRIAQKYPHIVAQAVA